MEEQKKTNEVKMNANTKKEQNQENKKLTYEQLNDACNQLWQQSIQLRKENTELKQLFSNKRLDYLFRVLNLSDKFPSEFVISCADEIKEALTVPEKSEDDMNKEK